MVPARLLDLTRLVSRLGRGPLTGIDRVEFAYLERLLAVETPLFALVRTGLGVLLLDRDGAGRVAGLVRGATLPASPGLIGCLLRRSDPVRARAEAAVRGVALARVLPFGLGGMLGRHLPQGFSYLNTGHANLSLSCLRAVRRAGGRVAVLLHDCIPLDYPQFTRPGISEVFARKLAAVSSEADLVIHTTQDSRRRSEVHLARAGRCPPAVVAPLGVALAAPDPSGLEGGMPARPYVLAVGTIEPRKNHALLLDVWAMAAAADRELPDLLVVGARGWAEPALFDRLATTPGVIEVGGVRDGAMVALLAGARALVFPSFAEGFGLPPLEAALLGVPVIASDLAVIRELLNDYPVYLDPTDSYSWLETIEALAQAPGPRQVAAGKWAAPGWEDHFNTVLEFA